MGLIGKNKSADGENVKTTKKPRADKSLLNNLAKIDNLPKDVKSSIPLRGFMPNGIIETKPGTFTKTYKLQDVNFSIAPEDEQIAIFKNFMDLLNSFDEATKWQFTIFNHEIDKKTTIENIRITPQRDGLNSYRSTMNEILLNALKQGNNSIKQDKYLTVAIEDPNADHAATVLRRTDAEISKKIRKITKSDTPPMTTMERMRLLYDIYNQDFDYRLDTGIFDGEATFDLSFIEKCGLSVKDVIGPPSFDFRKDDMFMLGDTYAKAMYLERVPTNLSTNFISDLSDIQSNMLISITAERIEQQKAVSLVRGKLATIEAKVADVNKKNGEDGYFGSLPPDLERAQKNARDLMNDITSRNQNLFFMTFTLIVFARTLEQLDENVKLVKSVASKHLCPIKAMKFQQEFCLNTALPLCRNDLYAERLYTTESASVFIPYNSQEINQKNAVFYGLNSVTKSMIMYDRLTGSNFNGLIFGGSGSGKSFIAKAEMISILLNHQDAQIFVIDPQGEYYPMTSAFDGQEVQLSPSNKVYINPLDLDISEDEDNENDPVTMKTDFVISMFDIIMGPTRSLDPIHTSIIDRCVRKIYTPYIAELQATGKTCDLSKCPTLSDLYQELTIMRSENYAAGQLADILSQYAVGSFDTFAHRTNVDIKKRFVVYNTKALGSGMKELGLHICTNNIWNMMIQNSKKEIYTWFYIDEFHVLLESDATTLYLKRLWKMARKWLGVPTGIMQNTEDLLRNADTRAIVNNTSFVIMLKASLMDRQNLADLFSLSSSQLEYITNSERGHGLIYNGKIVLPFENEFPKKNNLYKVMDTSHDAAKAQKKGA